MPSTEGANKSHAGLIYLHRQAHHQPFPIDYHATSPQPESTQHGGTRIGVEPPKDQKASDRHKRQRKSDNKLIEALEELFVPRNARGQFKKDRLGTSKSQCSCLLGG
jgi:hypothetical protein